MILPERLRTPREGEGAFGSHRDDFARGGAKMLATGSRPCTFSRRKPSATSPFARVHWSPAETINFERATTTRAAPPMRLAGAVLVDLCAGRAAESRVRGASRSSHPIARSRTRSEHPTRGEDGLAPVRCRRLEARRGTRQGLRSARRGMARWRATTGRCRVMAEILDYRDGSVKHRESYAPQR